MHNDIPNCFYRTSIKALIFDETGRFLLSKEGPHWEFPGGGLDHGEEPHEGLRREVREEMGLELTYIEDSPSYFFSWQEKSIWRTNAIYQCEVENLDFTPSQECSEIRFFNKEEALQENLFPNVAKFLSLLP